MALQCTISKDDFIRSLGSLQNITGKRGTLAILSNVCLRSIGADKLELVATDLEVGIKNIIPAQIQSEGGITLPSKKLFELTRESAGLEITCEEKENNWVRITSGTSVYNLAGAPVEEYPVFPEYDEEILFEIASAGLKELIDMTIFSVAQEKESNYTLTGMLFEKVTEGESGDSLRMVSSDGHRLSIMEKSCEQNLSSMPLGHTLIPKKGVLEIRKFCDANETIAIGFDAKQAVIKGDEQLLIIRLMNGEFPDYKSILEIVNKENSMKVERKLLLESLKRINIFTEDAFNAIQLDIDEDILVLSSSSMDFGNAKDELKISGPKEQMTLGFNCKYLIDVLNVMKSEIITLYINTSQTPCLLEGDDDKGFMSIIMPMKI